MCVEKKTTSVLAKFSSLKDAGTGSCLPFTFVGCSWRVWLILHREKNDHYLGVCMELTDFPPGWSREMILSFTLVNHGGKSNIVWEGIASFDAKNKVWGSEHFVSSTKLLDKGEGFVMNDKLKIIATLQVSEAESAKISGSPSSKEGNQASDTSLGKSQEDSSRQMKQETENSSKENLDGGDDTSEEVSDDDDNDDDDDTSEESSDDDTSEESSDDDTSDDVTCEESKEDDCSWEHVVGNDDASSPVSDGKDSISGIGTETAITLLDVNGFKVSSSQVESVSHIFKKHPDIASGFRPKNQQIRTTYMNELLTLIETLCQSPEKLSETDLRNAEDTLDDLTDVGFKLDWLKTKLNEVSEKKKKEQGSVAKIQTMEEELQKLKQMFLDLETQLQKEKAESLAAKTPLSFNDVV